MELLVAFQTARDLLLDGHVPEEDLDLQASARRVVLIRGLQP